MKKILLICGLFSVTVNLFAQFEYNSQGNIVPFSLSDKYKDIIDTSKVNTCMLPSYNNDSLYWEANFEAMYIKRKDIGLKVGFPLDTLIDFKKQANKYRIQGGTLWLYKIESKTAKSISIIYKDFEIPEGGIFSVYPSNSKLQDNERRVYDKNAWGKIKIHFWNLVIGNNMYIEYFEPDQSNCKPEIIISKIIYGYYDKKKSGLETLPNHLKKNIPTSILKESALENKCKYFFCNKWNNL